MIIIRLVKLHNICYVSKLHIFPHLLTFCSKVAPFVLLPNLCLLLRCQIIRFTKHLTDLFRLFVLDESSELHAAKVVLKFRYKLRFTYE